MRVADYTVLIINQHLGTIEERIRLSAIKHNLLNFTYFVDNIGNTPVDLRQSVKMTTVYTRQCW